MTDADGDNVPPGPPNAILGPTSNIFYALASETSVWTYVLHHPDPTLNSGTECVGLWPLEALCLAILLDEGIRCDVALVVAFARCLKTAGHISSIDVHTRREVARRDAREAARSKYRRGFGRPKCVHISNEELDRREVEIPMIRRYSALMKYSENQSTFSEESFDFSDVYGSIAIGQLPPKTSTTFDDEYDADLVHFLWTVPFTDSLDIAIIIITAAVNAVQDDTYFSDFTPDKLISLIMNHDRKWFKLLTSIVFGSQPLRAAMQQWVPWEILWNCCRSAEDAVLLVRTFEIPSSQEDFIDYYSDVTKLSCHHMAIIYAVHEELGLLDKIDFVRLFGDLDLELDAIEFIRRKGHYDELFSDATAWLGCLQLPDNYVTVELFRYVKSVGASFEGAAGVFGASLTISHNMFFADRFELLKFCIENDPIFPSGFSPSTVLDLLFKCSGFVDDEASCPWSLAIVKYIHELAVQHNLLGPDPVTGESLLTVAVRHVAYVCLTLGFVDVNGEPTIVWRYGKADGCEVIDTRVDHYPATVRFLAHGDPQPLLALFRAIEQGAILVVDCLCKEFNFDLHAVRHPVNGKLVKEFVLEKCNSDSPTLDYMVTMGVFDNCVEVSGRSLLQLACERTNRAGEPNIVHAVRFWRNTDLDPFESVDGKSLLHVLADAGHDLQTVCAFMWCMCDRWAADSRWKEMVCDFLLKVAKGAIQLGLEVAYRTRYRFYLVSLDDPGVAEAEAAQAIKDHYSFDIRWYARMFFIIQRAGVVESKVESSVFLQQCIVAAREIDHQIFIAAASTDYTMDSELTFQTAHELAETILSTGTVERT